MVHPIVILYVILLVLFLPESIGKSSESVRNAIVTSVGLDKVDGEYEVSVLTFIPQAGQNYAEEYDIVSSRGEGISDALEKASLELGKKVYLYHVQTAVLGKSILAEDVASCLDYLVRVSFLPQSCILVATPELNAKDLLKLSQKEKNSGGIKLDNLVIYNSANLYWEDVSIEAFYSGYFSPTKSSIAVLLGEKEDESEQSSSSSGESTSEDGGTQGGASSGGSNSSKSKILSNTGDSVVFRNGKKAFVLSNEKLKGLNWINKKAVKSNVVLKNFTDKNYKNADLLYNVEDKETLTAVRFENGVPIFSTQINLYINLVEIEGDKIDLKKNQEVDSVSEELKIAFEDKVRKEFKEALDELRLNKTDIINVYDTFYRSERKAFKKFLERLDDPEDYLNYIVFELTVNIIPE